MHLPGYISLLNPYNILQIFITYRLTISHTFCQNHLDPLINDWYNKITFGNVWVFPWTHFRFAKCQECHLGCFTNFNMYFKEERVNYHDHLVQTSLERTHLFVHISEVNYIAFEHEPNQMMHIGFFSSLHPCMLCNSYFFMFIIYFWAFTGWQVC